VDNVLTLREWHKQKTKPIVVEYPKVEVHKISNTQREEIKTRLKNGERLKALSIDYNVTMTTIWRIKKRLQHELELQSS
jgi:Mor family transcriptional regulator